LTYQFVKSKLKTTFTTNQSAAKFGKHQTKKNVFEA